VVAGSTHGAGGQSLGYLHQCFWALVELGKRAADDPAIQLRLEALDDIQFDAEGSPIELLQTKHHTGRTTTISASSVQVWRTINVWMDAPADDSIMLRLVTTSNLGENSELAGLRAAGERNVDKALEALVFAASTSENQQTLPWRKKFLDLDEAKRDSLVSRVIIDDGAPRAIQIDEALKSTFRYAVPTGQRDIFNNLLKGQWASIVVRMLSGSLQAITGYDLVSLVADISDQLKSDNLPVDPAILTQTMDGSQEDGYRSRLFVQQLLWIALDENRLWKAIRDYHRSYSMRSYWLRFQLTSEAEFDRFAFELKDEWEQIFDARVAAMRRDMRVDDETVGQEILEELARESRSRLRERFANSWFNRGMLHALADGELAQQIGWHPDFESKLEELLTHAGT
jgi:hypothetical protein